MRRRKPGSPALPKYLYQHPTKPGWRLYNPVTGKYSYLSQAKYTEAQAFAQAAEVAEQRKAQSPDQLSILIPKYLTYLEAGPNAASTLRVKTTILKWYANALGRFRAKDITRKVLMQHWETIGPDGWLKHRGIWIQFLDWCLAHGDVKSNEARATLKPQKVERVTKRHTAAGVAVTRAKAEPWLQIAIDLAIYSLQDRSTLTAALRSDVTTTDTGYSWDLTRSKVNKHLTVHIAKGTKLHEAVSRALAFPVVGPHLLRRPAARRVLGRGKDTYTQVLPDYLTKAFNAARDAAGAYTELSNAEKPSVHQLRAWGAHLHREAGRTRKQVQALMAHENEKMTAKYEEGHGVIEREDVEAGL